MAFVSTPRANTVVRAAAAGLLGTPVLGVAGLWAYARSHVNKGVGCVTCHGRVGRMPAITQVRPLSMGWCLEGHRNPAPELRPREAITSMSWEPGPGDPTPEALASRYDVQPRTNCTTCHR